MGTRGHDRIEGINPFGIAAEFAGIDQRLLRTGIAHRPHRGKPDMASFVEPIVAGPCCSGAASPRYRVNYHSRGAFFFLPAALR